MKFTLRKVRINNGGYDSDGRYYGVGMPLYRAYHDEFDPETRSFRDEALEFRAYDREDAKAYVLERFPNATFYR